MPTSTLADPTDFGNKPGDGPLRAGGQPGTLEPKSEENLPSTESRTVRRQRPALKIVRDIWGGTERMRELAAEYLPKGSGEEPADWRARKNRAVFTNFFKRAVEGLVGLVFRKDPQLSEDVPAQIREHWENIDLAGTHGDVFCRDLMEDAQVAGHAAFLVEFPQTDGNQRADQERGPIRPYWVPLRKDDIVSWRTTVESGRQVLTQFVIRESVIVPHGEFGEKKQERFRVFRRENGVVSVRVLEVTKDKTVVVVEGSEAVYPTQDEIPVSEVATSGRRSLFDSDPPLIDMAYLNIAHFQQWSDLATSVYKTNVPIFVTTGLVMNEDGGEDVLVLGPNSSLNIPNPEGKAEYVSHNGAGHESSMKMLQDLKSDMGSLGLAMLAPQKRSAETVEAKRLDKATSDSALAVTARALQDALEVGLGFHANYLRLPSGGSVEINRDFEGLLTEAPVMSAFAQLVEAGFPPRPVLEALQAGGRIREDADLDELELEWMVGAAVEAERKREEREAEEVAP